LIVVVVVFAVLIVVVVVVVVVGFVTIQFLALEQNTYHMIILL
jgi:hypothetical protein